MKKQKRKRNRDYITAEELLGKVKIYKQQKPAFINNGAGNGWLVYPDGSTQFCYIR